tara:strand:- start:145 stop:546 length:402 start_codon:yes stop_codon:yes gene_type:complete
MTNDQSNPNSKNDQKIYDLEERTTKFSNDIIKFAKTILITIINKPLISQLVRSATSVGANYCEADEAESKRDFVHKIRICKKEIKETKYWLRVIANANEELKKNLRPLWKEAQELNLIFSKIIHSSNSNSNKN